jgi:hypothetical protein
MKAAELSDRLREMQPKGYGALNWLEAKRKLRRRHIRPAHKPLPMLRARSAWSLRPPAPRFAIPERRRFANVPSCLSRAPGEEAAEKSLRYPRPRRGVGLMIAGVVAVRRPWPFNEGLSFAPSIRQNAVISAVDGSIYASTSRRTSVRLRHRRRRGVVQEQEILLDRVRSRADMAKASTADSTAEPLRWPLPVTSRRHCSPAPQIDDLRMRSNTPRPNARGGAHEPRARRPYSRLRCVFRGLWKRCAPPGSSFRHGANEQARATGHLGGCMPSPLALGRATRWLNRTSPAPPN